MTEAIMFLLGVLIGWLAARRRPRYLKLAPRAVPGVAGWLAPSIEPDGTVTYTWTWTRVE